MANLIPINAVIIVDRAEGNPSVGTQWQESFVVPLDMPLREILWHMFGRKNDAEQEWKMPRGRVTITIPDTIPAPPEKGSE